jgi:hypothetical protein
MALKLFPSTSTNSIDGKVTQFIKDVCSGGESIDIILYRSSTLFRFGEHFVQRQRFTNETDDTTEILASKLIENLTYNVSTGLYVFDVQGKVNKTANVPKHYQCVAAVYRSSTGKGSKVSMRLVTRALTGVCDNCYYYSQYSDKPSSKGQPESIIDFSKIYINSKNSGGIIHLLLGYKNLRKETVWLYAYFIRQQQKLVFMPCSSDPMRDVLMAASTIKNYLEGILRGIPEDGIPVILM